MTRLVIVGAGGHAAVVAEAAELQGAWDDICFVDDKYPDVDEVLGFPVVGDSSAVHALISDQVEFIVAIGDNGTRLELHRQIDDSGGHFVTVVHPSACVSSSARVQPGTVILAQAVVNARATIDVACIVNTAATIDHDCEIQAAVHISPGAHLAGGVSVGERAWVGIGASVMNDVSIGSNAVIGASAAVIADVETNSTAVGVPARRISHR